MPWRKGNRLKLVAEAQAPPRTREILAGMRAALGLPHVSVVAQALAAYPTFLELFWRALGPVLGTQEFFRLGERLRADAYTRAFNYFEIADLRPSAGADRPEISRLFELFQYKNPVLLLIVAAQLQAFDVPVGQTTLATTTPAEHPVFTDPPVLADEQQATPALRRLFDETRRTLGYPFVSYDVRALARWPQFLAAYWQVIKTARESPIYEGSHYAARETAFALAQEFPYPVDLTVGQLAEAGMSDQEIASVVHIVEMFVNDLSGLVLTSAIGQIALEGGTPAARERDRAGNERVA